MRVRLLFMTMPAQLNSRSDAALAGRGVFNRTNRRFSSGQVDRHAVSSEVLCRYCASTSTLVDGLLAILRLKKSSSSSTSSSRFFVKSLSFQLRSTKQVDYSFSQTVGLYVYSFTVATDRSASVGLSKTLQRIDTIFCHPQRVTHSSHSSPGRWSNS